MKWRSRWYSQYTQTEIHNNPFGCFVLNLIINGEHLIDCCYVTRQGCDEPDTSVVHLNYPRVLLQRDIVVATANTCITWPGDGEAGILCPKCASPPLKRERGTTNAQTNKYKVSCGKGSYSRYTEQTIQGKPLCFIKGKLHDGDDGKVFECRTLVQNCFVNMFAAECTSAVLLVLSHRRQIVRSHWGTKTGIDRAKATITF